MRALTKPTKTENLRLWALLLSCGYDLARRGETPRALEAMTGGDRGAQTQRNWVSDKCRPSEEALGPCVRRLAGLHPTVVLNPDDATTWVCNVAKQAPDWAPPSWRELDDTTDPRSQPTIALASPSRARSSGVAFDGTAALATAVGIDRPAMDVPGMKRAIERLVVLGQAEAAKMLAKDLFGGLIVEVLDGNNFLTLTANGARPLAEIVPITKKVIEDYYGQTGS